MFLISEGEIAQEKILKSSKLHISREKEREGQCIFKKDGDNSLSLDCTQITLAKEDLIRKAKIIRALKCVESSHSFSSTSNDSNIFKEMFRNWEIAKQCQQGETKTKYTIQYGIYPYLIDLLLDDIKNVAFTFKFNESTIQQVYKQHDGYVYVSRCHIMEPSC